MDATAAEFRFTVVNDLHYIDENCRAWLGAWVERVNATPGNELVLVLGDLAETGSRAELQGARDVLSRLKVPWYTVPGNHDGPPDRPSAGAPGSGAQGLAVYNELFPDRRNYFFTHKQWQFLGLDTTDGSGYQHLAATPETKAFARHAARTLDPTLPTILFTHFPLDPTVLYSLADGHALLDLLAPLNLRIVFSGHFHGLSENTAPNRPHLKLLTNRCISRTRELHDDSSLRGYFDCHTHADESVDYQFVHFTP